MTLVPDDELDLAVRIVTQGDPGGESPLRALCARFPQDARAHFLLGALLDRLGRDESSLLALERALVFDAGHVQAVSVKAAVLARLGRTREARELLAAAVERKPEVSQLWFNFGAVLESMSDFRAALAAYDRALALPGPPPGAFMNRGYVLTRFGRLDEALQNNLRLAELLPNDPDAQFNVAEVLLALRRPAEALAACERALRLAPDHSRASIACGLALSQLGRIDEAGAVFERVRAGDPDAMLKFVNVFEAGFSSDPDRFDPELIYLDGAYRRLHDCDWSERDALIATTRRVVEERLASGRDVADYGLAYNVLTLPLPDSMRLAVARNIALKLERSADTGSISPPPVAAQRSRVRVGYLSPDFREHVNAYLLHPLLRLHDRSRFEVFCYSVGPADDSPIRRAVENAADVFVDAWELDDRRLADQIRAHEIDVLIDVGGYTTYSRAGVMMRRPAPVQAGYLAFPGTQAMDAVPYRIVDRIASPPGQKEAWTESLVYLPDTFYIYDRFEPLAADRLSRSEYDLPDKAFVFCSFNNYYKIEPGIFGIWMEILRSVPGSVLWLAGRNDAAAANLRREAKARGVDADRLVFAPFESRDRYRARFALADLFLDTPLFNAMTTACDALAAGLPLLTITGTSFPSRVATSLLAAAGFAEGIADSPAAYLQRAIQWGNQPDLLAGLRRLRLSDPLSAPLFDTKARVKQIEKAFEEMWRRKRLGLPPESFDVTVQSPPARSRWH